MILVNLGCGTVYHPAWQNFDLSPAGPQVRLWDIRRGLPFAAGDVDAVYSSHVLEHLDPGDGRALLDEARRVLRPGGVLRIVVPDLEGIARAYLEALAVAEAGGDFTLHRWTRLELFDQLARRVSGGEMAPFARALNEAQAAAVRTRAGRELDGLRAPRAARPRVPVGRMLRRAHYELVRGLVSLTGGPAMARALAEGWFRQKGEIHRVMYDRLVLAELLQQRGFVGVAPVPAGQSAIPGFTGFELDAVGAEPRKPDSLYLEGTAP